MLSKKLEGALNAQINAELWSSYFYLSMSIHYSEAGLPGFSKWFKHQADEERAHAMKFVEYIVERGNKVALESIAQVPQSWKTPLSAFEDTLKHEKEVTAMIHNLYAEAEAEKDYATVSFLRYFVDEQVEEESTAQTYVDALKLIGENPLAVYMLDKDLGGR